MALPQTIKSGRNHHGDLTFGRFPVRSIFPVRFKTGAIARDAAASSASRGVTFAVTALTIIEQGLAKQRDGGDAGDGVFCFFQWRANDLSCHPRLIILEPR